MEKRLIYLADDELNIRNIIRSFLLKEGYAVEAFPDGRTLLEAFRAKPSDMVILDVMMPGIDGMTLCQTLRRESTVPVIMVSARDAESDRIAGLTAGSDDYLCKPFSPLELVARVGSLFRRLALDRAGTADILDLQAEDVIISPSLRQAFVGDKSIGLTGMEFDLLRYLASNRNRAVGRTELLESVWGFEQPVETRATDDMMKRVRKKLEDAGSRLEIRTIRGYGVLIGASAEPGGPA